MSNTVADLLDTMAVLNNEFDVSQGGADEGRAIKALTIAQHYFETIAATMPHVFQTSAQTVATAASTEQTAWPTALLRLDALWLLDSVTSRPMYRLKKIFEVGGHVPALPWPISLSLNPGTGSPAAYYANTSELYWLPLPAGVSTVRVYGMIEQAEFAARGDAFNYPARCRLALANFATSLLNVSVGDDSSDLDAMADRIFRPLLRGLRKFDRSEPMPRNYAYVHTT